MKLCLTKKVLLKHYGGSSIEMSKWEVILPKEIGDIVLGSFKSKREAEEEAYYRRSLAKIFTDPKEKFKYKVRKVN